jgi:hypothetical protein
MRARPTVYALVVVMMRMSSMPRMPRMQMRRMALLLRRLLLRLGLLAGGVFVGPGLRFGQRLLVGLRLVGLGLGLGLLAHGMLLVEGGDSDIGES